MYAVGDVVFKNPHGVITQSYFDVKPYIVSMNRNYPKRHMHSNLSIHGFERPCLHNLSQTNSSFSEQILENCKKPKHNTQKSMAFKTSLRFCLWHSDQIFLSSQIAYYVTKCH